MKDDAFFEELLRVASELAHLPTKDAFQSLVQPEAQRHLRWRYVSWEEALNGFLMWLKDRQPESPLLSKVIEPATPPTAAEVASAPLAPRPRVTQFGEPLKIRGMRYAPLNELGVIYLFGVLAYDLGFVVESIKPAFPDCDAKRLIDPRRNVWSRVQIEFEYRSSGFRVHLADAYQCDLLVCWEHDWKECPVDVLELQGLVLA